MKEFFHVKSIEEVLAFVRRFKCLDPETVSLNAAHGRVLARTIAADRDIPHFARSTMDGYAVAAASTFGASGSQPALLEIMGEVLMGKAPEFSIGPGQAAEIATGGMLPRGADAVVMVEHTEAVDASLVESYKSVAPGANIIAAGEDFAGGETLIVHGSRLRAQEMAVLAAAGKTRVPVYKQPLVGVLSTGDEIVLAQTEPSPGKIRDMNAHALAGQLAAAGARGQYFGIVSDDLPSLFSACEKALETCDMLLVSGGSSVGARDYTIEAIKRFEGAEILAHGVSISPGKPTILAHVNGKPVWGLPGHVVSAMVVFDVLVRPFVDHMAGLDPDLTRKFPVPAKLAKNVPSKQGRVDYIRVRLDLKEDGLWAEPILGKSGEIRTMVLAHGLVEIPKNHEGSDAGSPVMVHLFPV